MDQSDAKALPLYNAELITPPANATPKPNCPSLLKNCAIIYDLKSENDTKPPKLD